MNAASVLVVEDEAIIAKDIEIKLKKMGYIVPAIVATGAEAIQQAVNLQPDLILMDILLEGEIDGIEAADQIIAHKSIPIIYITAHADEPTLQRARITQPYGYIVKPIDFRELHSQIEMGLYKHATEAMLRVQHELAVAMSSLTDLKQALQHVVQSAILITGADCSAIYLYADDTYRLEATRGISAEFAAAQMCLSINNPLIKQLQTGKPIYGHHSNLGRLNGNDWNEISEREGIRALALIPIQSNGQMIALLEIGSRQLGEFPPNSCQAIEAIGAQIGGAIVRIRAEQQTKQQFKRLTVVRAIDEAFITNQDLQTMLDVMVKELISGLEIDAAAVLLLNPITRQLEFSSGAGFRITTLRNIHYSLNDGYAGQVASSLQPLHIPNQNVDKNWVQPTWMAREGFTSYDGLPLICKNQLKGVLEIYNRSAFQPDPAWLNFMQALAGQAAIAIDNSALLDKLQSANAELVQAYNATIEGWSRALELRDQETQGHSRRVTEMTIRMARALNVEEKELIHIQRGSVLHDIGKMGIPDGILLKNGPLTPTEWQKMHMHPRYAYDLLSEIPFLQKALEIPLYHHERWDGNGYPDRLKEEDIPLSARIFAIADVWDALRSDRPYHKACDKQTAITYIREQSGKHFDPRIVDIFLQLKLHED